MKGTQPCPRGKGKSAQNKSERANKPEREIEKPGHLPDCNPEGKGYEGEVLKVTEEKGDSQLSRAV